MRIDAYQIFASGCSENRLVGALEANDHLVILLKISFSKNYYFVQLTETAGPEEKL